MPTRTEIKREFQDYYFDRKEARRVIQFFERHLKHAKGSSAGQAFYLEPWQYKLLRRLFGWKSKATGSRKYKVLYVEIPRKNGKSTLGAGLALYLLDADREQGAEVISAAADADQAAIVFDTAKEMIANSELLSSRIVSYRRSMVCHESASSYKVISATPRTKHGINLHGFIVDELHAQENRELVDVLITSMAYRSQPLQIFFTTAGHDKNSICWEYHDYARKVQAGIIKDPTFLPVIYAADSEKDDWRDERTWAKANPNLGKTVRLDYLREQCEKAKEVPAYENTFKRLHLNIWTEQDSRWLPIEKWDACRIDYDESDLVGRHCYAGLDLASTEDITALTLIFPEPDGKLKTLAYFWLPEDGLRRRAKIDRGMYDAWTKPNGPLEIIKDRATIDQAVIRQKLISLREKFNIKEVAIDRWNASELANRLLDDGFNVIYFPMGIASMTAPSKRLNSLILNKELQENGNPILRWMAKNVAIESDAEGNIKPSKKKSKEKIDGIVALIMAIGRWSVSKDDPTAHLYESSGVIAF